MSVSVEYPTTVQWLLRGAARLPIPRVQGLYAKLPPFIDETSSEFVINFFGMKYSGNLSQYVDRHIFYFGSYSPRELSFLGTAASILRATRNHIAFVDVGANVGQHSLFMSRNVDRVIAFEPNGEVADRLATNIALNEIKNIDLVRCALGSEVGEGRLGSGLANNSGSRSLVWSLDSGKDIVVPVARGDAELEEHGVGRVDILKIDVEGFERHVFAGMHLTLERDRPIILFELVGADVKGGFRSEDELRDALYSGAELFTLGGTTRPRLLPFDWHAEEAVCLPRDLVPSFASLI